MKPRTAYATLAEFLTTEEQFLVRMDKEGVIRDVQINTKHADTWTDLFYYKTILLGRQIREFYLLPPDVALYALALELRDDGEMLTWSGLFRSQKVYSSRNVFERLDIFNEFHSRIPYSRLYLRFHGSAGLFGIVRFGKMSQVAYHYRNNPLVFLDDLGRIQAVNRNFSRYFGGQGRVPENFLGKAISDYVSLNLFEALTGNREQFIGFLDEKWKPSFSIDFSHRSSAVGKYLITKGTKKTAGALFWQPSTFQECFIQMKQPLDTTRYDFKISLACSADQGKLPGIIINGSKEYDMLFPDHNGYLLGYDHYWRRFQIKKEGSIIHMAPFDPPPGPGRHTIEIVKRGVSLAYFLDKKFIFGYRDPALYTKTESYQYLHLHEEEAVSLYSLELFTLPSIAPQFAGFNEVSLKGAEENAFYFLPLVNDVTYQSRLIDDVLYQGQPLHYAFILHDISLLRKSISLLEEAQKKTVRERDKYKALVMGGGGGAFVGESPVLLQLKKEALRAAASPVTVLIEGETGTGKEVLARYVHDNSAFRVGPFVKVDCSGIPQTLIESELFGVEKGAFTGASEARPGKLEAASGGTLFLDELSNLSFATQAKLLQFLQDFTLTRLGSTSPIKVNTRIIAATNRPLKTLVEERAFREDLYYRLSAVKFNLPPLRERREDIAQLSSYFLRVYNERFSRGIKGFAPAAHQKLLTHEWAGNIRELENVVQKAVLFCEKDIIDDRQIELTRAEEKAKTKEKGMNIPRGDSRALTREHVLELLRQNSNIIDRAVRDAKIGRTTFYNKLRKFKIQIER